MKTKYEKYMESRLKGKGIELMLERLRVLILRHR